MPKVLKTRKMKLKQRIRHRKSRVIKTKSRKNRYRRKTKYKVGGGFVLNGKYLAEIRQFLFNKEVSKAEQEYTELYNEFAKTEDLKTKYFDPKQTKGLFGKETRLHDILTKIKSMEQTETSRKVDDLADYIKLADSLNELVTKKRAQLQMADRQAALLGPAKSWQAAPKEQRQQQPQQQEQKYYKVFISDSNMVEVPRELMLFESGTSTPVTKIPQSQMSLSPESISQKEYDDIPGTPMTLMVGLAAQDRAQIVYKYKLSQNAGTVYYYLQTDGSEGIDINQVRLNLVNSNLFHSKYECHIPTMVPNCDVIRAITEPPLRDDKKQLVTNLWSSVNCLLQKYPGFFTRINLKNLKIVSPPSGGFLTDLVIKDDKDLVIKDDKKSYSSGKFSDGGGSSVKVTPELNAAHSKKGLMALDDIHRI